MPVQEGPRIYNESVMTLQEWKDNCKRYPNTCHVTEPPHFFKSDFEWRWRMGGGLTSDEIKLMTKRIDEKLKEVVR